MRVVHRLRGGDRRVVSDVGAAGGQRGPVDAGHCRAEVGRVGHERHPVQLDGGQHDLLPRGACWGGGAEAVREHYWRARPGFPPGVQRRSAARPLRGRCHDHGRESSGRGGGCGHDALAGHHSTRQLRRSDRDRPEEHGVGVAGGASGAGVAGAHGVRRDGARGRAVSQLAVGQAVDVLAVAAGDREGVLDPLPGVQRGASGGDVPTGAGACRGGVQSGGGGVSVGARGAVFHRGRDGPCPKSRPALQELQRRNHEASHERPERGACVAPKVPGQVAVPGVSGPRPPSAGLRDD
mmetsp:Transcript_42465/g.101014  ORF Transcript_42465/g.101014 Transcript_42465/m.101014 type:complete len:294 (+) Transcript_42465:469-1350(+)